MREEDVIARCANDLAFFCKNTMMIRTKSGAVQTLGLNEAQLIVHRMLESQKKRTGKVRAIILKGRQQGISTYIAARFYHKTVFGKGNRTFILTHEQEATNNLFDMVNRYHINMHSVFKPSTKTSNAKELYFDAIDSGYKVGTAGTKGVGRSQTVQLFHGSEIAFWPYADEHAAGILQAIPNEPGTEVVLESTANGIGNFYHRKWLEAIRGIGEYIPIFIPWFIQEEYQKKNFLGDEFKTTDYEQKLVEKYGLTPEQLLWRRDKVSELGSEELFFQEYPCCWEEAFLFSGRKFFGTDTIQSMREQVSDPKEVGELTEVDGKVVFKEHKAGWLEVWQRPDDKKSYVVGTDVAEGLVHGDINSGHVLSRELVPEQVARFSPLCEPDELGRRAVLVSKWYGGNDWLGIERNNMGIAACISARDSEYEYLFQMPNKQASDNVRTGDRFGWITTTSSRPVMLNDLRAALRDGSLKINSRETLMQLETFIVGDNGKPQAANKCLDDDVMGLAIAYQMIKLTEKPSDVGESTKLLGGAVTGNSQAWLGM